MRFSILKFGLLALVAGFVVGMVVSSAARGDTSDTAVSASSAAIFEDPADGIESGSNI